MLKHPGYGHRRVADALKINRKRALRVMKLYNLKPARRCQSPKKLADRGKPDVNFSDITRVLSPIAPNFLWVSDFTFISFQGTFVYLATILDRFTAEVLGASVMTRHTAELPFSALQAALEYTGSPPAWCHSDQGSEYNSDQFLSELAKHNIQVSMSPKASPWRNGAQESFFGRFKVEFGDPDRFETLSELIEAIYAFISYYNTERIHTRLRMAPNAFKQAWCDSKTRLGSKAFINDQLFNKKHQLTTYQQLMSLPLGEPPRSTAIVRGKTHALSPPPPSTTTDSFEESLS